MIFEIFWCFFAVSLVNQGDTDRPHICIAYMSCFQSLYCYIVYIIYGASHCLVRKLNQRVTREKTWYTPTAHVQDYQ